MGLNSVSPDFSALIQAMPNPVVLVREDGSAALNPAARGRLVQLGVADDWRQLFHAQALPAVSAAVAAACQGQTDTLAVKLPDMIAPGQLTIAPGGPGSALLHLQVGRDPLETALELLDTLNLGVTVQGADSRILYANDAAQHILGLSLNQLMGRDSMDLDPEWRAVHPSGEPFPGETRPAMVALQTGVVQRNVPLGIFHPPSGSWRWLRVTAVPRRVPGTAQVRQVTVILDDVTEAQRTEAALRHSERRFRSLVEATAQIVWTAQADGYFPQPQPGWAAFTGQAAAEYEGRGWLSAVHQDDRAHTLEAWKAAVESQGVYATTYRVRRADGEFVPMRVRGVLVHDEAGQIDEWIGTNSEVQAGHDGMADQDGMHAALEDLVHERTQRLAEVTRFSTLLLTAAGEGVFGVDSSGVNTFVNPSAARMLGYPVERLIGAHQHDLIHHHHADGSEFPAQDCPIYRTLRDGEVRRVDSDVFWHAQGHPVPVSYVVTPTHDEQGAVTGAVVMMQDITDRTRAQGELSAAMLELQRSNHDLEQFASVASHDLQEPLRTIGSYTELLARRYEGQLDARATQYLGFMQAAVHRMRGLIEDLLAFARVSRSESPLQPVALHDAMAVAAQNVEAALLLGGGTLEWDTPHTVLGQGSLVTQLLTNLVGNALKFVPSGRLPLVGVTSVLDGEMVRVSVTDNGIGIEPGYAERVFEIFQRLNQRETYAGNGMGLAICRRIVEHHGGRLWLESTPGQGSTFHFTLPTAPTPTHD